MAVLEKGTLFPETIVKEMMSKVKGSSSLASLSGEEPVPFNGSKQFIFNFDKEVDIVGESGKKSNGGVSVEPVVINPLKMEYGARVSDEFLYGAEEYQLDVLTKFSEGFAKKVARGIDIAAFHGVNPRTAAASTIVGANNFDTAVTQSVTATASPDDDMETAIAMIEAIEGNITGAAFAPSFRSQLGALKDSTGKKIYPELSWGQEVGSINGLPVTANSTVAFNNSNALAYVGDFATCFKWGYAKDIPVEVIEYGNPDNDEDAGDLKGSNQVYLRGESFVGWGILIPEYFAKIVRGA